MTEIKHVRSLEMSGVTDPIVADALAQLLPEWRARKRWGDMEPRSRALHFDILNSFLKHSRPPELDSIDRAVVEDLQERDLIILDDNTIQHAYPFSDVTMPHAVTINGVTNFTVCAIDALGAPAMVESAGRVRLECATCGDPVSILIGDRGLKLDAADPANARIWAGVVETGSCAASSQCQSMLGFCSLVHLEQWREKQPQPTMGFSFNPEQALQAGVAIFRPFMDRSSLRAPDTR